LKIIYYLLFFIVFPCWIPAQDSIPVSKSQEIIYDLDSPKEITYFDKDKIQEYRSQDDFNYTDYEETDTWWTRFKKWVNQLLQRFFEWLSGGKINSFWGMVFQILPYIVVIGVLILLGWLFLKVNPKEMLFEKQDPAQAILTEDEDIIQNQDIQQLINQALQNKNYRLAIRYYYLSILKKLSDAEMIQWEAQKTNTDYTKELADTSLLKQFKAITKLYDYIWYGSFEVNESSYVQAEREFKSIGNQIKN